MVAMSRFLDRRGRIFGKVNIVDLLVLLVIVAVVVFAVVRMTSDSPQTKKVTVQVTFTVEEVRQATVKALTDALQTGGYVKDDGGTKLGTLIDVVATPTIEAVPTAEGELKAVPSPVLSDVEIVVEGQGQISESTVNIGGVPMRVGKKVTLIGTGFEVLTVIMKAEAVE
jgi:hypothetical protein